jgi:hypothetical protein
MHKVYRHKLDGAETSIYTTDEFVDGRAQILVLLDVLSRGHGKLREDNLSDPLWVLSEEELERMKLLRNTLDVVEPVDSNDDLDAVEALLEGNNTLLNGLLFQILQAPTNPI